MKNLLGSWKEKLQINIDILHWYIDIYNIDILDYIVIEYRKTYHSTIKTKSIDVKSSTYIDFAIKIMIKILDLKLVIMFEYHTLKIF